MLNIKRIFETIADAGQKILEKKSFKSIAKKRDLLDLCDDLLSTKGAAFGITLARDILFRYQNLSNEEKNKFLVDVNDKYKPDPLKIDEAIKNKCNLIISHHPVIFSGVKKINGTKAQNLTSLTIFVVLSFVNNNPIAIEKGIERPK